MPAPSSMPTPKPAPPTLVRGIYRHYKGGLYLVKDLVQHSEDDGFLVLYQPLYGDDATKNRLFVRPYAMFFENVCVDGVQIPRFCLQEHAH